MVVNKGRNSEKRCDPDLSCCCSFCDLRQLTSMSFPFSRRQLGIWSADVASDESKAEEDKKAGELQENANNGSVNQYAEDVVNFEGSVCDMKQQHLLMLSLRGALLCQPCTLMHVFGKLPGPVSILRRQRRPLPNLQSWLDCVHLLSWCLYRFLFLANTAANAAQLPLAVMAGPKSPQQAAGWLAVAAENMRDSGFLSTSNQIWPYVVPVFQALINSLLGPFALYFKPFVVFTALSW